MTSSKQTIVENIRLGKLVHGGQCLAEAPNGKKLFVWGGLPDELVSIRITKKKSSYLEGIVEVVHEASADRIAPIEPLSYLSTSPWQIMTYDSENKAKQAILEESLSRVRLEGISFATFVQSDFMYNYRNKNEFGFWGADDGLNLAHYVRGTSGKQIVQGSSLAMDCINKAAVAVRDELNRLGVWGGDLKTIMLRSNKQQKVVGALFIKKKLDMDKFELPKELKGLDIYYSNPKSPASIPTKKLYSLGDITLSDSISGINITYDVMSFFQVNLEVFGMALDSIKLNLNDGRDSIDMYSGVGTIGLAVGSTILVESDKTNVDMAKLNVLNTKAKVVHASSETALEFITDEKILILDPPRSGLHKDLISRIISVGPSKIVYLSCNPSTQARDIKLLEENYNVTYAQGFNFFPRTPHIESLVILDIIDLSAINKTE